MRICGKTLRCFTAFPSPTINAFLSKNFDHRPRRAAHSRCTHPSEMHGAQRADMMVGW
jgi:hypothetical protein